MKLKNALLNATALALAACMEMKGPVVEFEPLSNIISEFEVSTKAAMMSIGDTLSVDVSAVSVEGGMLSVDRSHVKWISKDSASVYVDTLGRIIARKQTERAIDVIASYTHGMATLYDTISVNVTVTRIDATSIRLVSLDSARIGAFPVFGFPRIRVDLYNGDTLVTRGAEVPVIVPPPVVISYNRVGVDGSGPVYIVNNNKGFLGEFWAIVSLNLYGTEVIDSVMFKGDYAAGASSILLIQESANGEVQTSLWPDDRRPWNMQPCGFVRVWSLLKNRDIDVVFTDSLSGSLGCEPVADSILRSKTGDGPTLFNVIGGNVLNVPPGGYVWRRSNTKGQFDMYIRDAVTKERFPVLRRYNHIEKE